MASNASSDALGFPVRGMPKTVREKNIIFNVIKYFEDEKERHGKQKFRPNAVMQKAAEATGVPLRTLQRLSNAKSESKKIKCKKAKLSREKFGKLDDFDLGVIRRLIHQFYLRNESPKSVEELFRKRHAELKDQPEFWKKCVEKVKRIEEDYRKSDISVDIQVEKLCVELHPDSLSDSDELECLSSEMSDIES